MRRSPNPFAVSVLALSALAASALTVAPAVWANDTASAAGDSPATSERLATARAAIKAGQWKAAQNELKLALLDEPKNADLHNLLAYSYRKQASPDLPKAFEHYQTALKLDPRHKGAHEYIGEAYLMDQRPAEAEKHLAALEKICGNKTCEEYADLAKALSAYKAKAR